MYNYDVSSKTFLTSLTMKTQEWPVIGKEVFLHHIENSILFKAPKLITDSLTCGDK